MTRHQRYNIAGKSWAVFTGAKAGKGLASRDEIKGKFPDVDVETRVINRGIASADIKQPVASIASPAVTVLVNEVGGLTVTIENRTIDDNHQAALAEEGVVTCWYGGDETKQQDALKSAFEERFPGVTLNITVDVSKYHNGNIDRQLATGGAYVDSVILQTMHDYPRWANEGALLHYQQLGFDDIHS
ncbi:hypothetical protein CC79DRAFT_1366534 [Sarocladium strictum]